jgi:hypothetical protein
MIYVLVPAFDEAPTVGLLLWKVRQLFDDFPREYQLIVVNDGSADASDEVLARYERALPMTLLTHRRREGYARSLEELLRVAARHTDRPRRDMAVTLQADFSDPVDALPELIRRIEGGADIAVADRRRSAAAGRGERWARRLIPAIARAAVHVPGADDLVGTMRVYRLAVIERLVREAGDGRILAREGWAADLELLVRAARHARKIESVPVTAPRLEGARASRRRHLRDAWRALRAAFALRRLPAAAAALAERPEGERGARAPERQPRHERHERRDRQRQERAAQPERGPRPERRQKQKHAEPRPPRREPQPERPAAEVLAVVPSGAPAGQRPAGEGRRRRRRGRGRGRGKGGTEGPGGPSGAPPQGPALDPGPDAA